ncbi:unnamed protein product [Microthlaspi erraticum]|uniref:Cystatin domain-containing protein n=1 Tax=Microthlaspi erraticum TaxID=1685480 RepID=A0A6D2ICL4_9BRAS|nr:unnamed protein product [Microthlaspi erraticum]
MYNMDWTWWLEDAYFLYPPGDPECLKYHYITKTAEDEPKLTIEQETELMNEQIEESEGFDIDFSMFRSLFNYHLVDPDDHDFLDEPETDGDLMKKLSQESIKRYNEESETRFEFVEVVKANYHCAAGYIILVTFDVLDPSDNKKKTFQARIYYSSHYPTEYVFVRLKPNKEGHCDGISEEDVSKGISNVHL